MARLTAVLGAASGNGTKTIDIEYRLVNLHRNENYAERYLLSINPKGQVPTMEVEGLPTPLTDSRDISYWFCNVYPSLLPEQHRLTIGNMLTELHAIEALSLSADRPEDPEEDVTNPDLDALAEREDISDGYRRALIYKKQIDESHMLKALYHDNVAIAEAQAKSFFEKAASQLRHPRDGSLWFFGGEVGPTVLDAHLVPFIVRLDEAGRAILIPEELLAYARAIVKLPEWHKVTHGRRTMWDVSYGHVHLLPEI